MVVKNDKVVLDNKAAALNIQEKLTPMFKKIEGVELKTVTVPVMNSFGNITKKVKEKQKIWEVFFDHKDKKSTGHRIDPLSSIYRWKV